MRRVPLHLEEKHSSTKGPDYIGDHPGSDPGSTAALFLFLLEFENLKPSGMRNLLMYKKMSEWTMWNEVAKR